MHGSTSSGNLDLERHKLQEECKTEDMNKVVEVSRASVLGSRSDYGVMDLKWQTGNVFCGCCVNVVALGRDGFVP